MTVAENIYLGKSRIKYGSEPLAAQLYEARLQLEHLGLDIGRNAVEIPLHRPVANSLGITKALTRNPKKLSHLMNKPALFRRADRPSVSRHPRIA